MMTVMLRVLLAIGLFWAIVVAGLFFLQERLLFHPEKLPADFRFSFPQAFEELWFDATDGSGAKLHALHLQNPDPKGVIFYLHGNGGNVDSWSVGHEFYRRLNFDVVMLDYRGYGKSGGQNQNEAQMHADVKVVWQRVAPLYQGKAVVVFGRSLGSGLAVRLASEIQPDLTVLVSAYQSVRDIALAQYPFIPSAVLKYPFDSQAIISRITKPVILYHGENDRLIPQSHSEVLAKLNANAKLVLVPQAGHNDISEFPTYRDGLAARLNALK